MQGLPVLLDEAFPLCVTRVAEGRPYALYAYAFARDDQRVTCRTDISGCLPDSKRDAQPQTRLLHGSRSGGGDMLGSGIFFTPGQLAAVVMAGWQVYRFRLLCGTITQCGAPTLGELSAMLPRAGVACHVLTEAGLSPAQCRDPARP